MPGKRKGPVPQEQLHQEDRPNTTAPEHGEEGLFWAWGKGNNIPFRVGSEGAVSTPGRCGAAPHWGLFGTAGGPTSSPHPMGATHGEDAAAPAQRCHPNDLSLHAGNGPAVMSQGRAAASLDRARAVPTSSVSHLYSYQQQPPGPIPLQGARAECWVTAPLLSCLG